MLRREVSQLRLEIERIARENTELKRLMNVQSSVRGRKVDSFITMDELNKVLSSLRNDLNNADSRQRIEIVAEVSRQMERLASQTEAAMRALADSIDAEPELAPVQSFSRDYSRKGIAYVVKPGDTLSNIAREYHSTVRDIQNANKIGDPKDLKGGQTIFIPQSE